MTFLTVSIFRHLIIIGVVFCSMSLLEFALGQSVSIFDRFRPINNSESNLQREDTVKVVSGTKVKRFERLTVPLKGNLLQHPAYGYGFGVLLPRWQAGAYITGEGESAVGGSITFQQLPYNNDIRVSINVTGLPAGKHAVHIHTFGDISQGCKSTGGQFPNNFIGNVDAKEDGSVSAVFISVFLTLFGFNGIIGRSIVIHEKPIDLNLALNAEVFSSAIKPMPDTYAYQNEENAVGAPIACGVISIMSTEMMPPPPPEAEPARK